MQGHEPKMTAHSTHLYVKCVIWCQIWGHNSAANLELQEEKDLLSWDSAPFPEKCA